MSRTGSETPTPGLAIVTVTHNSAVDLAGLLDSVTRHLPAARTIVVDSGSSDDSLAVARAAGATAIDLGRNAGYGAGSNTGVAAAVEPVCALLNPDVELPDGTLADLAQHAARDPAGEYRLYAPLVLNPDGTRQDTVHPAPTSTADLARALVPPGVLPGRTGVPLAPWRARGPRRVGWAVGCAIVARTATLRALGPFDERLWLYGEDLELGLRAARQHIETWFWPDARVVHRGGHASGRAFGGEPFALHARTRHEAVASTLGPSRALLDDVAQMTTFATRGMLKRAIGRPALRERRQLEAVAAVRRSRD